MAPRNTGRYRRILPDRTSFTQPEGPRGGAPTAPGKGSRPVSWGGRAQLFKTPASLIPEFVARSPNRTGLFPCPCGEFGFVSHGPGRPFRTMPMVLDGDSRARKLARSVPPRVVLRSCARGHRAPRPGLVKFWRQVICASAACTNGAGELYLKLIQNRKDLPNVIQPPSFSRVNVKPSQIFSVDPPGLSDCNRSRNPSSQKFLSWSISF
jgi:hypothetical protein